jgi:hypothetical protein
MKYVQVSPMDVTAAQGNRVPMTLDGYRQLIGGLQNVGYSIVKYEQADPKRRHLILRHDVDMCLARSVRMAEVEAEMGIQSYYFILVNTELYNINSRAGRFALRRLEELGHEVGLHFDPSGFVEGDQHGLDEAVTLECAILEKQLTRNVSVLTLHRPAKWLQGYAGRLGGRAHGYEPRFFSEMGYCSDSEGRFRYHYPMEHPAVLSGLGLQLVIHPIWWCAKPEETALAKLVRFLEERERILNDELASNCRPFAGRYSSRA